MNEDELREELRKANALTGRVLARDDEQRRKITRLREAIQSAIALLQQGDDQGAKYVLMDATDD